MKTQYETYLSAFIHAYHLSKHQSYNIFMREYWKPILAEAQNHRCCWCGKRMVYTNGAKRNPDYATIEHIIPKSCGGEDHPDNYAISCQKCNNIRGSKSIEEFMDEIEYQRRKELLNLVRTTTHQYYVDDKWNGIPYYKCA